MRSLSTFCLLFMVVVWSSCETSFETVETSGNLQFSRDTVFLDTIFSRISSSTYTLKVYNPSPVDIHIPEISLAEGEDSHYRLNVDGLSGKKFRDIEILARDSIYVFIETTIDLAADQKEFLYKDILQFKSDAHLQEIPLITLVKDAILLFPGKDSDGVPQTIPAGINPQGEEIHVKGFYLKPENLTFTRDRPYVIFGYAVVPPGKALNIEAGSRIHFSTNSGLIISEDASLAVKGEYSPVPGFLEHEVVFEGERPEELYENIPGQWGTIWFKKGSRNSSMNYATIRNAAVGLFVEGLASSPGALQLRNVQIYNSAVSGIKAFGATISGENVVVNNSGQASLSLIGGSYLFRHSTITNYWRQSYRSYPALYISNDPPTGASDLNANFFNSIIFGNEAREIGIYRNPDSDFNLHISHALIRFNSTSTDPLYDFNNTEFYENILINEDPLFQNPQKNNLRLTKNSAAINKGHLSTALEVPFDLLKNDRTEEPDLGAYEWVLPTEPVE